MLHDTTNLTLADDALLVFCAEETERAHPELPKGETLEIFRSIHAKSVEEIRATEKPERCAQIADRMRLVSSCGDAMLRTLAAKLTAAKLMN